MEGVCKRVSAAQLASFTRLDERDSIYCNDGVETDICSIPSENCLWRNSAKSDNEDDKI